MTTQSLDRLDVQVVDEEHALVSWDGPCSVAEAEGMGVLIESAPRMLAALRRASAGFEHHPACVRSGDGNTCNCAMNDVRAAIAAATRP